MKIRALNSINLEIENGEFISITGLSTLAKSMLLSILGLLAAPGERIYWIHYDEVENLCVSERDRIRDREIGSVSEAFKSIGEPSGSQNC